MKPITSISVVKLGSGVLGSLKDGMREEVFISVLQQAWFLREKGIGLVVVSSGAMLSAALWAKGQLEHELAKKKPEQDKRVLARLRGILKDDDENPTIASIGQPFLMDHWRHAGAKLCPSVSVSQILVTDASIRDRQEWSNTVEVIRFCFARGIIPVVNYNDAVSFAEVEMKTKKAGENDKLTAVFAPAIGALTSHYITGVGGVYRGDPHAKEPVRYKEIDWRNPPIVIQGLTSASGRGGMDVKIVYAIECRKKGVKRVAISLLSDTCIIDLALQRNVSTMIGNRNVLEQ